MENKFSSLIAVLPNTVKTAYERYENISEIRLRKERHISLVSNGKNITTDIFFSKKDIEDSVLALCKGSIYSFMDTIVSGYIPFDNGIRVGVCGNAVYGLSGIKSVSDISSLCIRIPIEFVNISMPIVRKLSLSSYSDSILLFSPPGVGKTTVIRDLAKKLSESPISKRVALVDSRREIANETLVCSDNIDILSGYDKAKGIEIATRCLNPEYIICDEIGSYDEAEALLSAQNCGVPIIASAHGGCFEELLKRKNIFLLYNNRLFKYYVLIKRKGIYGENSYYFHSGY